MTKQQLIDMLLGQKPKTVSAKSAGPVDQTVFKPKSLVQRAAEKLEHSIKRPAILPKQSQKKPTQKTLAANAMVTDKIKYFENLSDKQCEMKNQVRASISNYKKDCLFQNLFHNRLNNMPGKREKVQILSLIHI